MQAIPDMEETFRRTRVVSPDGEVANVVALVGRDFLHRCIFTYDGPSGCYPMQLHFNVLDESK